MSDANEVLPGDLVRTLEQIARAVGVAVTAGHAAALVRIWKSPLASTT